MILTLTMNPAVGLYTTVEKIFTSHKMRCAPAVRDPGGGGINVARAVHRAGVKTRAVFPAGGAIGALLGELIDSESVPYAAVPVIGETRENLTVFETSTGQEYRFVLEGPALSKDEMESCLAELARADSCEYLIASGSLPPGVPDDFFRRLVPIAQKLGAKFVIDSSGPALKGALGPGVFLIKPSLREMESLAGKKLATESDMLASARTLIAAGQTKIVALTLGAEGAMLVAADEAYRAPAPRVEVLSTVGSGDSFLAALIVALSKGAGLAEACRQGVAAGSAALRVPGTKLSQPDDAAQLATQIEVTKLS